MGTPLGNQVAGHIGGIETTEDGSLVIKSTLPLELEFYQTHSTSAAFEPLRQFLPQFFGTLRLEGEHDTTHPNTLIVKPLPKDSIVLQNLAHTFLRPNIVDIKLGTVLYDEAALPAKRARAEKSARDTTTLETGMRITGFQVYDNETLTPIKTSKVYGKSIKPAELPSAISRCFPVASTSTIAQAGKAPSLGLPRSALLPILESLREDVVELHNILEGLELRMVGASLLIIHESDWDRAAQGITYYTEEGSDDSDSMDDSEEDEEDEVGPPKRPGVPFTVNLIDFAHTRVAPGEGPDRGVLLGLSTLIKLLDGRIQDLRATSMSHNIEVSDVMYLYSIATRVLSISLCYHDTQRTQCSRHGLKLPVRHGI
ncbi:SAICAR synthase-like protein [Athelia psychrophila]|uniref:Kinase n=1 Tax=Athelia psychrophila TaxID=1759441 RepID=A0A166CN87_9AGAM|nr:SAICAR synthase-like protein [Fibularhizoctonia sp. CBS 109695]